MLVFVWGQSLALLYFYFGGFAEMRAPADGPSGSENKQVRLRSVAKAFPHHAQIIPQHKVVDLLNKIA